MTSYRTSTVHTVFNKKGEKVRRETAYLEDLRTFQARRPCELRPFQVQRGVQNIFK